MFCLQRLISNKKQRTHMILGTGAEAIVRKIGDKVEKERVAKQYRITPLDVNLRKSRTRREAKVLEKLETAGIAAPHLFAMDDKKMTIDMEFIDGQKLRDIIHENPEHYGRQIGETVAKLHTHHIIHADLTTSNMIIRNDQLVLIDFGLSFFSHKIEDKAVDIHLLYQALESTHHKDFLIIWDSFIASYKKNYEESNTVLQRFAIVQQRGRNKNK
ncbi:Kae1-associated serine/threonine protein kinase [Candidatus Woesearchaeota archaeon]|nr:Kae1-associated serine/threonine protein kinase [Candidatus Woesearchaeota archaeon]